MIEITGQGYETPNGSRYWCGPSGACVRLRDAEDGQVGIYSSRLPEEGEIRVPPKTVDQLHYVAQKYIKDGGASRVLELTGLTVEGLPTEETVQLRGAGPDGAKATLDFAGVEVRYLIRGLSKGHFNNLGTPALA